jgi:hypothetical protein
MMQAFLICCHNTSVHITSAIVSLEYVSGLTHDNLDENQYLFVKRSHKYDLAHQAERKQACREILGLLRYLSTVVE